VGGFLKPQASLRTNIQWAAGSVSRPLLFEEILKALDRKTEASCGLAERIASNRYRARRSLFRTVRAVYQPSGVKTNTPDGVALSLLRTF
jgi:hypothetical protein